MPIVYQYTNKINGKIYIGQTSQSLSRRANNGNGYCESPRFYDAIQEFGWDSFDVKILMSVDSVDEAKILEQKFIAEFNSTDPDVGYNIAPGGDCGAVASETRQKISTKAMERYKLPKNNPMSGRRHSEETLAKMSAAKCGERNPMYRTHWSPDRYEKCYRGGWTYEWTNERRSAAAEKARMIFSKKVHCIEDGKTYNTLKEASDAYCISISTLSGHLHGRQKNLCR